MDVKTKEKCPCGTGDSYDECCGVFHKDITKIETAEQLMRSRYSAFVRANGNYLMESHHSSTRPVNQKYEIVRWAMSVKWLKLEIEKVINGQPEDEEGEVVFNAYYMERFQNRCLHEHSKFVKENGHWVYLGVID